MGYTRGARGYLADSGMLSRLVLVPSAKQTITAVGDQIQPNAVKVVVDDDASYTLTSTPTIPAGVDGQVLYIQYVGSNTLTLQDETALPGSLLRNHNNGTCALGARDLTGYIYDATEGVWMQLGAEYKL